MAAIAAGEASRRPSSPRGEASKRVEPSSMKAELLHVSGVGGPRAAPGCGSPGEDIYGGCPAFATAAVHPAEALHHPLEGHQIAHEVIGVEVDTDFPRRRCHEE